MDDRPSRLLLTSPRFIIFGLELFNTAYKRSRFSFQDPAVIARLEPMVTVIGNTLYSKHMQVVIPGLKASGLSRLKA